MATKNKRQLKIDRGLATPTTADFEERLKDPNSLESKLRDDCELVAAIAHHEIIHLLHAIARIHKLAAQELATKEMLRAERAMEKETKYYADLYSQQQTSLSRTIDNNGGDKLQSVIRDLLKRDMVTLIATSQANMTAAQLATHHKQVTANFNNQISAALGQTITAPVKINNVAHNIVLNVPQLTFKPIASVPDILKYNPAMPRSTRFSTHATLATMGYLAVLNKWREMLEHNKVDLNSVGIDIDDIQLTPQALKQIDKATQVALTDNSQLLMHLLENNLRAMGKTEVISKLPTLFSTKPVMAAKAWREEDELEHSNRVKPSSK